MRSLFPRDTPRARMRPLVACLAFALLAPAVLAGSPAAPEAPDAAGDAEPDLGWNDMLGAWFEEDAGALVLGWSVREYDGFAPSGCWNLDFFLDGVSYDAIVQNTPDSVTGIAYRRTGDESTFGRVEVDLGAPAVFRARLAPHVVAIEAGSVAQYRLVQSCSFFFNVVHDPVASGAPFVASAGPAPVTQLPSVYEGSFAVGDAGAFFVSDACTLPEVEGVTSSCVALAASDVGNHHFLEATDATGLVLATTVCFYDDYPNILGCDLGVVPAGAAMAGIAALGGAGVAWRLSTTP